MDCMSWIWGDRHPKKTALFLDGWRRLGVVFSVVSLLAFASPPARAQVNVWTYHNNNSRTGQNTNEAVLNPANVNPATFGKIFTCQVDSYVFGQPLCLSGVDIPGQGLHNVLYVATEHDSVYAFDADQGGPPLWQTSFLDPANGVTNVWPQDTAGATAAPEMGVTATPVIDTNSLTIYVLAETKENGILVYRLHALDVTTGHEFSNVVIQAVYPGTGDSVNDFGQVVFDPFYELGRPGLALVNGVVYLSFGSLGDIEPCHGWLLGYDAASLAQVSVFCTSPNGGLDSIWMSGAAPAADAAGNIYVMAGNGDFSTNASSLNQYDYGSAFIKLSTTNGLNVADFFIPFNQAALSAVDLDLGSGGPLLLPDEAGSSAHPHLLTGGSKDGTIYLLDRDNLGRYNATADQVVQEFPQGLGGVFGCAVYFNQHVYYSGAGTPMAAFRISGGSFLPTPDSTAPDVFSYTSGGLSVSALGTNNGIVWGLQNDGSFVAPSILHAYDAANLGNELYSSKQMGLRDQGPICTKFLPPTIANGKVYVAGAFAITAYGLASWVAVPSISPPGGTYTNGAAVTISCSTPGAQIYYTTDNSTPTLSSPAYSGPFVLTNLAVTTVQAQAFATGMVPSLVSSVEFFESGVTRQQVISVAFAGFPVNANDAQGLNPGDMAGVVPQPNWNDEPGAAGGPAVLSDQTGQPTAVTLTWNAPTDWGTASGDVDPNHELFSGYITSQFGENATVTFSNLPSGFYNLLIYTVCDVTLANAEYTVNGDTNQTVYLNPEGPIFSGAFALCTNTDSASYASGNYVEFDNIQPVGGTITVVAVADDLEAPINGLQLIQTAVAPTVSLTSPQDGALYVADLANLPITALATDQEALVPSVSFYVGTNLLAADASSPYQFEWTQVPPGVYSLTAQATGTSGLTSTSAPVNITIEGSFYAPYGISQASPLPPYLNMPASASDIVPPVLSQTGAFSDTLNLIPADGLIPYNVNVPLWSDGAAKSRWMAVPSPATSGSSEVTGPIGFSPSGSWSFPLGTVLVKNFELNVDQRDPGIMRRLETRLLVFSQDGGVYGATYKWRPDNSDADLLTNSLSESIIVTNFSGVSTQAWYYPSPADCLTCHTPQAGYAIGVNTRQLNGSFTYPLSGITDNQLRTLNQLGLFNPQITDETTISSLPALVSLTNSTASLEDRARSYLDANCANCHQPGGAHANFDARWDTPLADQNIINGAVSSTLGIDHAAVVVPNDIWRSIIYQRANSTNALVMMPPLAHNMIDTNAVQILSAWIDSLGGLPTEPPPAVFALDDAAIFPVSVVLQDDDSLATIYYTLDSTMPTTNSLIYSGPIPLTSSAIVTASAFRGGFDNSIAVQTGFNVPYFALVPVGQPSSGQFHLQIQGTQNLTYVLQSSTDLLNWVPIATNIAPANLTDVFVPTSTNSPLQFFRAVQF